MAGDPFELNIDIPSCEAFMYIASIGATVVGCLKHDVVCLLGEREQWSCPDCGFRPRVDAPPFVVKKIDYRHGIITVG